MFLKFESEGAAKLDMVDVPYKGAGPALNDVIAGQVKVLFDGFMPGINYHRAGQLKILAVKRPAA